MRQPDGIFELFNVVRDFYEHGIDEHPLGGHSNGNYFFRHRCGCVESLGCSRTFEHQISQGQSAIQ